MDAPRRKFFGDVRSATLACTVIAGSWFAADAADPRDSVLSFGTLPLAHMFMILGPALANRTFWKAFATLPFAILTCLAVFYFGFWVNGRETMPLTVWGAPMTPIAVPWLDDNPLNWQVRALIDFNFYWLLTLLWLRLLAEEKIRTRAFSVATAMIAALVVANLLYVVSWQAYVSGTFKRPLYSDAQFWFSLGVYALHFPVTPYCFFTALRVCSRIEQREPGKGAQA